MKKYSAAIADSLFRQNIIQEQEKEIYIHGIHQLFTLSLNFLITVLVGIIFHSLFEMLLLTAFYMTLRRYAGGYHAKTELLCYVSSIVFIIANASLVKYITPSPIILGIIFGISGLVIVILSPVEHKNKPLDDLERIVFTRRMRIVLLIQTVLVSAFVLLGFVTMGKYMVFGTVMVAVMVIGGELDISNKR